jgi:short-subunit dehydrogenase
MIERGSGHIINVSSAAGIFTIPCGAAYSATKFAVVGMSEVLRSEVARLGIGVTCVCPALVKTSLAENTRTSGLIEMDLTKAFNYWGQVPEKTAVKILKGVKKNKRLLLPTIDAKIFYFLKRFFPGLSAAMSLLAAKKVEQLRAASD